jgi:hypothetical protein
LLRAYPGNIGPFPHLRRHVDTIRRQKYSHVENDPSESAEISPRNAKPNPKRIVPRIGTNSS